MHHSRQITLWQLVVTALMIVGLVLLNPLTVQASTHVYEELPGQTTYRSQQSLRDGDQRSWQAIFFKRFKGQQLTQMNLRLVGFPGLVTVNPNQDLQITLGTGVVIPAITSPEPVPLPTSVGQYDVLPAMAQLTNDAPLTLSIPLRSDEDADITVPPFVIREWRTVANQDLGDILDR